MELNQKNSTEKSSTKEQFPVVPEAYQEGKSKLPSAPGRKLLKKRIMLLLGGTLLFLFIISGGFVFWLRSRIRIEAPTKNIGREVKQIPIASTSEGTLQISAGERLKFPSGAIIELENNQLYFSYNEGVPRQERLSFDKKITVYVNGYLHKLESVDCKKETQFFGDYWAPVVTGCNMQSSIVREEKPSLSSYRGTLVNFPSVANKDVSRFRTIQEEPWIAVSVPYFQIAKGGEGSVVNVVSPREDVVNVYTNFGRVDFQFGADELNNKMAKTAVKGPLTISLVPQELSCAPPYKIGGGNCYVLEWKGTKTTTYNLVNFLLTIDEQGSSDDYPLLIDIES